MKQYDKLIFVSGSDTSTSPMAEAILQNLFLLEDILIDSKGLVVLFPEPINPKAEAILVRNGMSMKEHTSEPLGEADFDERTLILTMDEEQKKKILADFASPLNVYALPEYIRSDEVITDPYGGALADYGKCFEQLRRMVEQLAAVLSEEETALHTQ